MVPGVVGSSPISHPLSNQDLETDQGDTIKLPFMGSFIFHRSPSITKTRSLSRFESCTYSHAATYLCKTALLAPWDSQLNAASFASSWRFEVSYDVESISNRENRLLTQVSEWSLCLGVIAKKDTHTGLAQSVE